MGGFHGCLSQINVFDRVLDFVIEIPRMLVSPYSSQYQGTLLRWAEFIKNGLVWHVQPSTVQDSSMGTVTGKLSFS